MLVEQGALGNAHVDVGHADEHADAAVRELLGPLDLVEIFGCVVVDGGPEQVAQVLRSGGRWQFRMRLDGGQFGVGTGRKIRLKAVFDHVGMRRCDKVKIQRLGGVHRKWASFA